MRTYPEGRECITLMQGIFIKMIQFTKKQQENCQIIQLIQFTQHIKPMKKYIFIAILLLVLISCQQQTKKYYYDSGELKYETYDIDKRNYIYHIKTYYKNGYLKEEGNNKGKGTPDGHWKEYYSDGVIKWEGDYSIGHIINPKNGSYPDFVNMSAKLNIKGHPKALKLGQTYKIRLYMKNVHPSKYVITNENFTEVRANPNDSDKYPYIITPIKTGNFYIWIIFPNNDGVFLVGNSSLVFKMNVIK